MPEILLSVTGKSKYINSILLKIIFTYKRNSEVPHIPMILFVEGFKNFRQSSVSCLLTFVHIF